MKSRLWLSILLFAVLPLIIIGSVSAGPKARLYEVYNSTSTPAPYKRFLEHRIKQRERIAGIRAKHALTAFRLGSVYATPNPVAGRQRAVVHVEAGLADKVEIKIYDPAGKMVEEAVLTEPPVLVKGVYAYEYRLLLNNVPYTCGYTVKAYKSGKQPLEASGRIMFLKMGN